MKTISTKNRTMPTIIAELNASVDKYNISTDSAERANLAYDHKKLVAEYNELSLYHSYAEFMRESAPLVALAKAYYYDTISVKDNTINEVDANGTLHSTVTRSVNEGKKKLDIVKFIEWTEASNKSVASKSDWKIKTSQARTAIENEWKKFFATNKDTHSMSIGKAKKALQAMFDSLVFIPTEKGDKNCIIANGDIAKWVLGFANDRKDSFADGVVSITGTVLSKQKWNALILDILHKAVEKKEFEIFYGEPEDVEAEADAE